MYCRFCGTSINEDCKYCPECGKFLAEIDDYTKTAKTFATLHNSLNKSSKDTMYFLWWTLLMLILGVIIYDGKFYDIVPLFPLYFGGILLVYTIRFYKRSQDLKKSSDDSTQGITQDVTQYSLQEFAELYGKMQICRYQDEYGTIRSKCVFTRSIDVNFSRDIGELTAKEVVANKNNLVIIKQQYGDGYLMMAKEGETIVRQPSTSVPPPLDKVSNVG